MTRPRKPSAALVVATLALIVAGAGTASATGLIDGRMIRDHSITANKLAAGAVTAKAIRSHAITKQALAEGVVVNNTIIAPTGPKGDQGPGGTGPLGPIGPPGPAGIPGVSQIHVVETLISSDAGTASCAPGEIIVGGGGSYVNPTAADNIGAHVLGSIPNSHDVNLDPASPEGWSVFVTHGTGLQIAVFAVCAAP